MFKSVMREITLAVQARSGVTAHYIVWLAAVALTALIAFAFLCVAGDLWLSSRIGDVDAALIMSGSFFVIAIFAAVIAAVMRRRTRERAILERAARARTPSWLLDPKFLATAVQIGRSMGWERIIPIALLGFLAAQWTRERRVQGREGDE
jgi:hypothetical protein